MGGKAIKMKDSKGNSIYPCPYYPIGSIYLSVNDTNPTNWFDGTWELIAQGRTLVGVDTNDTDFNTVKKTGGSKYIQDHIHKDIYDNRGRLIGTGYWEGGNDMYTMRYQGVSAGAMKTGKVGDVQTGNSGNLQPYFTCYIWCRIA